MKTYSIIGEPVGEFEIPDKILNQEVSVPLLHEVVIAYLANQRKGTACVKTRSEVSGGGRKPWSQKHTGRARAGSTRSPLWRKGGVVFGPKPRSYRINLPRQKLRKSLLMAIHTKLANNQLIVLKDDGLRFGTEERLKTKKVKLILDKFGSVLISETSDKQKQVDSSGMIDNSNNKQVADDGIINKKHFRKVLLVPKTVDENLKLAVRNLSYVRLVPVGSINTYDILNSNIIITTEEALLSI